MSIFSFMLLQTRVLVTHGVSFLPQVDKIIVLVDGKITEVCIRSSYDDDVIAALAYSYLQEVGSKQYINYNS